MLYFSIEGENSCKVSCTLCEISPYRAILPEKIVTPSRLTISLILKSGAPICMPNALASLLRAMAQPSLLDKTMTGRPFRSGRNNLSQETKKLLQSANANISYNTFFIMYVTTPQTINSFSAVTFMGLYSLLAGIR